MEYNAKTKKWYQLHWFDPQDTPAERKLITKLDFLIVPWALLGYWVKFIDQANINNAYVSGLREELGFRGNELVNFQMIYTVGAVLGQLPCMYLFTRLPMHWIVAFMDIGWGVFTLLQYRAQSYGELMAYRFMVGWFEAAFFPAIHYVLGSWYKHNEIARRGGLFYCGLTIGTLTASLIQSAASSTLEGVNGLSGWRWMYIICSVITLPIGILALIVLPGTPNRPNRLILTEADIRLATDRLHAAGHATEGTFTLDTVKRLVRNPKCYIFIAIDVLLWNASLGQGSGGYLLWLKSLGRYPTPRLNQLGAIQPGLGVLYALVVNFSSDLLIGPTWAVTMAETWSSVGLIILTVWNVPEPAKWFAYMPLFAAGSSSSVIHGMINSELKYSPQERAVVLCLITILAQSTTAWTNVLVFPTLEAPRFVKGWAFSLGNGIALITLMWFYRAWSKRQNHNQEGTAEETVVLETPKLDLKA